MSRIQVRVTPVFRRRKDVQNDDGRHAVLFLLAAAESGSAAAPWASSSSPPFPNVDTAAAEPQRAPPPPAAPPSLFGPPPHNRTEAASGCVTALTGLTSCSDFLGGTQDAVPTALGACCVDFRNLLNRSSSDAEGGTLHCICPVMLREVNRVLQRPIDVLRVSYLPVACGLLLPPQMLFLSNSKEDFLQFSASIYSVLLLYF